jgi:amino acid transporter
VFSVDKKEGRSFIRIRRPGGGRGAPSQPPADERKPAPRPAEVDAQHDEHERIVIPRQDRGSSPRSDIDVELREVRRGVKPGDRYLRVVPGQRRFTRVAPGHYEATRLASRPPAGFDRVLSTAKGVVLGSPFATAQAIHERLTRVKALSVLGSDPLSSSAYATEEALIILALAGTGALIYSLPISLVVALLMVVVVISYRQTQKAYPSGGGAYIVAHENLGRVPGLTAGAALMVDYVLLVSVSVAAGVAAITSAVPELYDWRVPISVVVIALFTLGNLRGIRESGTLFAAPTYFFILAMGAVVAIGLFRVAIGDAPGSILHSAPPREELVATQGLSLWLILRAFSSGGAALTGVEAMSNNIPNFQPPESENARKTLTIMAVIAIYLFLGITYLSTRFGLVPAENDTIVSQLGRSVLGENPLYFAYQATTALILFLAANTSFYDFPLLSAILARDKYMPRQFAFRGDRLAFSNGIMVLAGLAIILLIAYEAKTTKLIPLYAVGVFVSFTLSQSGMVKHWLNLKEPGWRASLIMNGVGAVATGVVAVIITATKFTHGAWISILMMAVLMIIFMLIRRHYDWFTGRILVSDDELPAGVPTAVPIVRTGERDEVEYLPPRDHVIVPVDGINKISLGAIGMARELSRMVTAVHLTDKREEAEEFRERWRLGVPDIPLQIIESPYRQFVAPMLEYLHLLANTEPQRITVILPSFVARHWWERVLHNRDVLRLRPFLSQDPEIRLVDFPYRLGDENGGGTPPGSVPGSAPRPSGPL